MGEPVRDSAIHVEGLSIGHDKKVIVQGLQFRLARGETLALVGGNGSGKTTLLRTLAGLLPPLAGTIEVLGTPPSLATRRMAWLGQFQNTNPLLPLRARDVVRMAFYPDRGLWTPLSAADEAIVDEALNFFGARAWAKLPISDLSGGQRQRIYLAYVLARRADLILMDEPLSSLDTGAMELYDQALTLFREKGATVVVATHNLEDAAACDQALMLGPEGWRFGPGDHILPESVHHH